MRVGHVSEAWLYPVKSMAGQRVDSLTLDSLGVIGDRTWAMLESETGDVAWGKRFPKVMDLTAEYVEAHPPSRVFGADVPPVRVRFPDGTEVTSDAEPDASVSGFVGSPLTLRALQPPENVEHYHWSTPPDEKAIMQILGVAQGEAPPDLSVYDEAVLAQLAQFYAPPGTYNDLAPLHVLTTASLRHMQDASGEHFDLRRFRPSFLIDTAEGIEGLAEFSWIGKTLQVGEATLRVEAKTIRCSMPARPQAANDLPANPKIAKALYTETNRFLGAYLSVPGPGRIAVGDAVELND